MKTKSPAKVSYQVVVMRYADLYDGYRQQNKENYG